ncbi:MAG: 30S ribosomal protein S4 [Bacilli bacterium]
MARYTGPAYKKSRYVGISLTETGKELAKRPYRPGQHGQRRRKVSGYGVQLIEKQKVRFMYGLNEKQFRRLFDNTKNIPGVHAENFLKALETRLDNVIYRMGIATTRRAARQVVNHGHILVNGKKVDIPSYRVKPGDTISVRESSREHKAIVDSIEANIKVPEFVTFDKSKMEGIFVRLPERSELNSEINESLIIEFYSR